MNPIWQKFKDRYDAEVAVISSSQAEEDCVWVFVKGGATDGNDGAILLTPEQASLLRDGLDAWLEIGEAMNPTVDRSSPAPGGLG